MKLQSTTNLLTAIISAAYVINFIHISGGRNSVGTFVGACPLNLNHVCAAVKQDLEEAKFLIGGQIDDKAIDAKCSCTNAKSVCDMLAEDPPYDSVAICKQVKNIFLDPMIASVIDCKTCGFIENTCNLLKSCKAPDNKNNGTDNNINTIVTMATTTISTQVSTLIQSSIAASSSNDLIPNTTPSISMMALSSTTNIYTYVAINHTTQTARSTSLDVQNIRPSSALMSEAVIPTSSINSGEIGSKDLIKSLMLIVCFIMVVIVY